MEELLIAVFAGFFAGVVAKKLADNTKKVPVFKDEKIKSSDDILIEARKAQRIGADSASILLAFGAIESRLRSLTGHNEATFSINKMLSDLDTRSLIDSNTLAAIKQLAKIRNEIAHSENESNSYSAEKVESYLTRSEKILQSLEKNTYHKQNNVD